MKFLGNLGLISIILISWGIALFEYFFMVPANRIGYNGNGGPFSLMQLKSDTRGYYIGHFFDVFIAIF